MWSLLVRGSLVKFQAIEISKRVTAVLHLRHADLSREESWGREFGANFDLGPEDLFLRKLSSGRLLFLPHLPQVSKG